jgi:Flp pilus assembly protein TadB
LDDGPRTGGLQALLLIVAITAGYVLFGAGAWGALPFLVAAVGGVIRLEIHARRRRREEREERPMPPDPFDGG